MIKLILHKAPIRKVPPLPEMSQCGKPKGLCQSVREGIRLCLVELKKDKIELKNLPVQDCAGRFSISPKLERVIKGVNPHDLEIERVGNNRVRIPKSPILAEEVNGFIKKVPEFMTVFTHADSYKEGLDKHTLAVFKKLVENPEYEKLNKRKKRILKTAALLHDLGKAYTEPKTDHAHISADIAKRALAPLNMEQRDKKLVLKLIEHHHYAENIAKKKKTYKEYTQIFNKSEFKLLKILTTADIQSKKDASKVGTRLSENATIFAGQDAEFRAARAKNNKFSLVGA